MARLFSRFAIFLLISALRLPAQTPTIIRINASQPYMEPDAAAYQPGTSVAPDGQKIGVNARYLTLNGKPWLPVMGEFHFSRYPQSEWEEEILKMKASGVQIVSTYVIWIHHEEVEGVWDWTGQRDLRRFTELCAKHGMYVLARVGPWAHGEVRNGGFPDWLLKKGPVRRNNPVYLSYVRQWYTAIAEQLHGLLWKEGGPVIGIQLENEYAERGEGAGAEHILELKRLARQMGLDVPFYTVTGWDNAAVPAGAVLPVYGGYPDAPWDGSINKLPPGEVYAFRFHSRVAGNMGAIGQKQGSTENSPTGVPFLTAEIGGGIEDTYHRRPVIQPNDIAAMFPVMLGSGANLYGTYMFQGGENPEGRLTTLQESQATGYPNDLPVKSYDFQAPLGEFGKERVSFRRMKLFQYFLNDFGADLAPMVVHAPDVLPQNPADFSVPRVSVRSRGNAGFLFFNNYVRGYSMPEWKSAQFILQLPKGTLRIPRRPVTLPPGVFFIWPFNLDVAGARIRYSTAQLFTRLEDGDRTTLYFFAQSGIPVEIALDPATVRAVHVRHGRPEKEHETVYLTALAPGMDTGVNLTTATGKQLQIVVLTQQQAEEAWKVHLQGKERLLFTTQDVFSDEEKIYLDSRTGPAFHFQVQPTLEHPLHGSLPIREKGRSHYFAAAPSRQIAIAVRQTRPAGAAPPVKPGPAFSWRKHSVAEAPDDSLFDEAAARWEIALPGNALDGLSNLFLRIQYQGDVARLTSGNRLLTDNFYNGTPWCIGLKRFFIARQEDHFTLSILPLRKDAPIYLEHSDWPEFPVGGQVDVLKSLEAIPQYRLTLETQD